ncbi:unnamed protein product [Aphanomyces euteiches]
MPTFLQGSTMSNDMAAKYKQNNLAPSLVGNFAAQPVKEEVEEVPDDEALRAEIVLGDSLSGQSKGDDGFDDDEEQDMEWEWCETSQEDADIDLDFLNEVVTVQGVKHELLSLTDSDLEQMTREEYVDYFHKCKLLRERFGRRKF